MQTQPIKVLYVDDEEELLHIGKIYLEKFENLKVYTSNSAQNALDILKTISYDAIVSDYQMPGMDGIQFLQKVRMDLGTIPFILFTGKGREEVVIDAINHGVDFYLQKGGEPKSQFAELAHKVLQAVGRNRNEQEIAFKNAIMSTQQEVSPDAILIVDNNGIILNYNRNFVKLWPVPEDLLTSHNDDIVIHYVSTILKDQESFRKKVQYLYSHPEEASFDEIMLKDGRIIERYSSPMIGENGFHYGRI